VGCPAQTAQDMRVRRVSFWLAWVELLWGYGQVGVYIRVTCSSAMVRGVVNIGGCWDILYMSLTSTFFTYIEAF